MKKILTIKDVNNILNQFFPEGLHKKRSLSIVAAVFGLLSANRLMSSSIGRSLAANTGKFAKHCIKQVDRLLGNQKWDLNACFKLWVLNIVGNRKNLVLTMDWSEFCYTGHFLLSVDLVTKHGRTTPLIWQSLDDRKRMNNQSRIEMDILGRLRNILPDDVNVVILADRGFGSTLLFDYIENALGWSYVIRLKKNHYIETADGDLSRAMDHVPRNGKIKVLRNVGLMRRIKYPMPSITFIKTRRTKEPWILASNLTGKGQEIIELYKRRFTCEENFRDLKDDRFGMGFKETIVTTEGRMDRLLFLYAYANLILKLLGAVGEKFKYSETLKANTSRHRTHSLYRQGREYISGVNGQFVGVFRHHLFKLLKNMTTTKQRYAII